MVVSFHAVCCPDRIFFVLDVMARMLLRARINPGVDQASRCRQDRTPPAASTAATRSGSRCRIKAMAQGSRPRRSGAFTDAGVDTLLSVGDQGHPIAVQFGVGLTGSPPSSLQEG